MAAKLDNTLAALADPTRRRVVDLLRLRPRRPSELSSACRMSAPAMSRHLRVLRSKGLIEEQRGPSGDARLRVYRLRRQPFVELREWAAGIEAFWQDQLGSYKAHAERSKKGNA
jgi:DNA-binding transcriptional ArsR family regulator